ncbi:MAG: bifunctional hydroxymethylpyrimidine kinase/phosphomethylpyrimidine kinase [Rhodothermus sp.]|nr:bifunctional hydroxymethylpyrimidine kinase/phosphomethylpyrimidine kinase [Rhodothermus sp.]
MTPSTPQIPPVALTIAGSDSGGGAGIQADIKAMQANGVFAASVITAVTAQNTRAVTAAFELPLKLIEAQIDAVFEDLPVGATKTGMLSSAPIIDLVARKVEAWQMQPLVVDPVMISKSGYPLLKPEAIATLRERLLPLATLVTPNAHEAAHLTGLQIETIEDLYEAARRIKAMGPQAVLVKGGHLTREQEAIDVLYDGNRFEVFRAPRIDTPHTHGTGCTYASAIAANLARGFALTEAIRRAKQYVTEAIRHALPIGQGHGPTHHFYFLKDFNGFPIKEAEPPRKHRV